MFLVVFSVALLGLIWFVEYCWMRDDECAELQSRLDRLRIRTAEREREITEREHECERRNAHVLYRETQVVIKLEECERIKEDCRAKCEDAKKKVELAEDRCVSFQQELRRLVDDYWKQVGTGTTHRSELGRILRVVEREGPHCYYIAMTKPLVDIERGMNRGVVKMRTVDMIHFAINIGINNETPPEVAVEFITRQIINGITTAILKQWQSQSLLSGMRYAAN